MTGQERVKKALSHQEPDQIPFDIGDAGEAGSTVLRVHGEA